MPLPQKIALSWSGGKDAAYCLWQLLQDPEYSVEVLVTTFHKTTDRSSMHGHTASLIQSQARAIGIPLHEIWIEEDGGSAYENAMKHALLAIEAQYQVTAIAFGDLFLEDVREYRESQMKKSHLDILFPIWKVPTDQVANTLLVNDFKAKICTLTAPLIDPQWIGKDYDQDFISSLSTDIDPCGENGEFHTFLYDAPFFKEALDITTDSPFFKPVPPEFEQEHNIQGHWYIDILE